MRDVSRLALVAVLALPVMASGPGRAEVTFIQQAKLLAADAAPFQILGFSAAMAGDTAVVGAPGDNHAGTRAGAAYVFMRDGSTWSQQAKLIATDAAPGDEFGSFVAVSGDTAVVGAVFRDDAGWSSGAAYVFVRDGSTWSQQAKLTADDAEAGDFFGVVAVSGDTAVVGAFQEEAAGPASGSAYVFVRDGSVWTQQAKLVAADAAPLDNFGFAVAVSADTAVIGAGGDDDAGPESGSAYVFVRDGSVWTQQAKLTAGELAPGDGFGDSVAVSGDTALVGALLNDAAGPDSGTAYVFAREGSAWGLEAKLAAADLETEDRFGGSVALDGGIAVVGADGDDDAGESSGSAYVFLREGSTWSQQAKLTADDADAGDLFGVVATSGGSVLVGAGGADHAAPSSGSAYIFAPADVDADGVPDHLDACPGTRIPESVPTLYLGVRRWALVDGDRIFDTVLPPGTRVSAGWDFTVDDTAGCSCEQIIESLGLGLGHVKFGCSIGAMGSWAALVDS